MLEIQTFGGLTITLDGERMTGFASRKAEALFVYLACQEGDVPREVAATLLWSDSAQSRALANLSVMLTSLRKQLGDYLQSTRYAIRFNREQPYLLDVETLRSATAMRGELTRSTAAQLAAAIDQYHGDFLVGFAVRHAPEFESWVILEQEQLRQQLLSALERLIAYYSARDQLKEAIGYARQLVEHDSLNEAAQSQLIELLWRDGQQAAALAQAELCRQTLWDELGVEPEEELIALIEKVQQQAPPERTSAEIPTNLPPVTTRFFGRSHQLATLRRQINDPTCRLITIVGQGGVGKSRLAIEVARHFARDFRDGIYFISLAAINDKNGLITTIADAVGLTFVGTDDPADQLTAHLKSKEMLLILDNFEQLTNSGCVDFVAGVISAELQLLITSRERLNVQAESLLELNGLSHSEQISLNDEQSEAAQLFIDRARRLKADVTLDDEIVTQLCQLVEGLPLALELAASWIRVLPLDEIVQEVERGLDLLETTLRDVPDRHRSIRAVFQQSWQMLGERERDLYAKLSVFRGGFTREAAQAVAGATLPLLLGLVDKSLLRRDEDGRFWRHPLLVQFAAEKLGDEQVIQDRHARYFAEWGQSAEIEAISADFENIRRAWQWLITHDPGAIDPMIAYLDTFYQARTRTHEATALFDTALNTIDTHNHPLLTAKLQIAFATYAPKVGLIPRARAAAEQAIVTVEKRDNPRLLIDALQALCDITHFQGELALTRDYLQRIVEVSRTIGDERRIMNALNGMGNNAEALGNYQAALDHFAEGLKIAHRLADKRRIAIFHNNRGIVYNRRGDSDAALSDYTAARLLFEEIGHEFGLVNAIHNIGMIHRDQGRYDEAIPAMQDALARHRALQNPRGESGALSTLGTIHRLRGEFSQARNYFHAAIKLQMAIDVRPLALASLGDYAYLEFVEGRVKEAVQMLLLVRDHPATMAVTRDEVIETLAEWEEELPPAIFLEIVTGWQAGQLPDGSAEMTLEDLVARLVT